MDDNFLVRVSCMTYNHAPYIEDAMNGFCMQETTFPFVCIIVDDASTDGEQKVIQNYLDKHFVLPGNEDYHRDETDDYIRIYTRHKTNCNCYFVVLFLKYNHYSIKKIKGPYYKEWTNTKYIALCEGDDYWIDSKKLQKQVDFLESHLKHTLCIHAYRRDTYNGNDFLSNEVHKYTHDTDIIPDKDVLKGTGMFAATASMVFRRDAICNYPEWTRRAPVGDRPLQLVLFSRGSIGYLDDVMSVYRVGVPGSWTLRIHRNKKANRQSERSFLQMYKDFDDWTNGKYHVQISQCLYDLKKAIIKKHALDSLRKPYLIIKRLF